MSRSSGPEVIASPRNARIQAARKLRRRAGRDAARAFLLEGPSSIIEALERRAPIREIFVSGGNEQTDTIVRRASDLDIEVLLTHERAFRAVSDTVAPQGAVAVVEMPVVSAWDLPPEADLALVLAEVRDPGNAGTLVRSAAAAGAAAVFFGRGCVDPYGPKTVRSSAGAILRLRIVRDVHLDEGATALRSRGFSLVGAEAGARTTYDEIAYDRPVGFVLGNEGWGMTAEARSVLDEVVAIPMPGRTESLNVAVAGSVLLFEAVRQRRKRARSG